MELLTHNAGKIVGEVVSRSWHIAQLILHLHMYSKANLHNKANNNYWLTLENVWKAGNVTYLLKISLARKGRIGDTCYQVPPS